MVLKGLRVLWVYLGEIIIYGYNFGTDGALNQNLAPAQKELIVLNILKYK